MDSTTSQTAAVRDRLGELKSGNMLTALWMEYFPSKRNHGCLHVRRTGCVLVDPRDRILALECTGESHAIVRALMKSSEEVRGCDIYVSRFPCSLCTKVMVQAGIRKVYYFPARGMEMDWKGYCEANQTNHSPTSSTSTTRGYPTNDSVNASHNNSSTTSQTPPIHEQQQRPVKSIEERTRDKRENNISSVMRLVANNSIAMSKFIPSWNDCDLPPIPASHDHRHTLPQTTASVPPSPDTLHLNTQQTSNKIDLNNLVLNPPREEEEQGVLWHLDDTTTLPSKMPIYPIINQKFLKTMEAIWRLWERYGHSPRCIHHRNPLSISEKEAPPPNLALDDTLWRHAIVLAHIAAKRTDDPKIGVGAVLVYEDGHYGSVGWNGYPKMADVLDYPQGGADDFVEMELKYDYILHAEQNALLWRMNPARSLAGSTMVTTKMPCDECSPVLFDSNVTKVVTNVQIPKSVDDPARLRGLTYEKIARLMEEIWIY